MNFGEIRQCNNIPGIELPGLFTAAGPKPGALSHTICRAGCSCGPGLICDLAASTALLFHQTNSLQQNKQCHSSRDEPRDLQEQGVPDLFVMVKSVWKGEATAQTARLGEEMSLSLNYAVLVPGNASH